MISWNSNLASGDAAALARKERKKKVTNAVCGTRILGGACLIFSFKKISVTSVSSDKIPIENYQSVLVSVMNALE